MALQMQYTDSRGVSYPASYWVVDDIFTSKRMLQGSCLVRGWRDAVAASQGLDTISERPVSATGAAFIAMLTDLDSRWPKHRRSGLRGGETG